MKMRIWKKKYIITLVFLIINLALADERLKKQISAKTAKGTKWQSVTLDIILAFSYAYDFFYFILFFVEK